MNSVFLVLPVYVNNESIVQTQRDFRTHFAIRPRGVYTILHLVKIFNKTGSILQKRRGGSRSARTLENVERMRLAALTSPNGPFGVKL